MAALTSSFPQLFLKMEWSSKDVIRLIGAYRERPELWDHNNNNYKVVSRKNEAWNEIAYLCGTDTLEVRRKMNSVLASFRRERKKVEMAKQGAGENDEVCSSWFGYEHLQFLIDKFRSRGSRELDWNAVPKDCDTGADEDAAAEMLITNVKSEAPELGENSTEEEVVNQRRNTPPQKRRLTPDYIKPEVEMEPKRVAREDRDECEIFGELIASQLRHLDYRTRCIAQHSINNVIFHAQMGVLTEPQQLGVRGEEESREGRGQRQDGMPWHSVEPWSSERQSRMSGP